MTQVELKNILLETNLPVAYKAFREPDIPDLPFIVYQDIGSDNFGADNKVYFPKTKIQIDLITRFHSEETEKKLEDVLDDHDLFWEREPDFDSDEDYYRVTYEITI
jgi:hypothetical protein